MKEAKDNMKSMIPREMESPMTTPFPLCDSLAVATVGGVAGGYVWFTRSGEETGFKGDINGYGDDGGDGGGGDGDGITGGGGET